MARIVGTGGIVKVGANTVAAVVSFGIEEAAAVVDDTALTETESRFQADRTSWTASVEVMWDKSDTTGQGAMTIGATIALHLLPEGDASGDNDITGSAIITGKSRAVTAGEIVKQTFQVQGSGALSESALA